MTIYPTVSCRSWRAADCSQNNRLPVDRYVTPIYVDLGQCITVSTHITVIDITNESWDGLNIR